MTKKLRISLSLVYCVAITLLFLPFMKQALIIFRTQTASVQQIETTNQFETVPLEAVQPPNLSDVLEFKEQQNFPAAGRIIIPKVEIALPLFPGLSNEQLLIGAGILFPERRVEDQNVVIVGHHLGRSNLLFGKLMKVKVGDNIYLERQNKLYQYRVSEAKKIQQTELKVLEEGTKAEITLITCDKPTQTDQRFVVKGELVRSPTKKMQEKILSKMRTIQDKNKQKNLTYCWVILFLYLSCLGGGLYRINQVRE